MKIKRILIVIITLFITACNAQYNLELNDNKIKENLYINTVNESLTESQIIEFYSTALNTRNNVQYNFDYQIKNNNIILKYNQEYDVHGYQNSLIGNSCFEHFKILEENEKYYITAQGSFRCFTYEYIDLETLEIIMTSNHKVLENNADEIKGDKYIWHINKNYPEKKMILFVTENRPTKNNIDPKEIITISVIVVLLVSIVGLIIYMKHKQVNKI